MAQQVKLDGKFATAEDTAKALGVPPTRLDRLKALALSMLPKRAQPAAPKGAKIAASASDAKVNVKSRAKKSPQNAPTKNRATATS
jgi:hypothetical protein